MLSDGGGIISESGGDYFSELGGEIISESGGGLPRNLHLRSLDEGRHGLCDKLQILTSDDISADYIIRHLSGSERGTVAVIDYLQILDQQRSKPALSDQVLALGDFARQTGVVFGFISQVDRSFDPESKRLPDIRDIRLPNLVDLRLFNKAYFLHNGEARLQDVA
ncbi:DNA helicase [Sinorhizobium meliloti]|uniref:DNA helicase n=1 Tax=Rhizobium meliloti TaxID=382 RepID=UPI0004045393|nr:DNA helicase [Sinorhizobium meliloti]MDE4621290.1 DNA helicase [Sinorhizobium meliloti]